MQKHVEHFDDSGRLTPSLATKLMIEKKLQKQYLKVKKQRVD